MNLSASTRSVVTARSSCGADQPLELPVRVEFRQLTAFLARHPVFCRVFLADGLSQMAQGMLMVAFPMFILQVTGDISLTGLAFSGEVAAFGVLSPLAGYWADRLEQKRLMIGANLGRIALLSLLASMLNQGGNLAWCLLLSLALGATSALFVPSRAAFLRRVLVGEDLLAAVALEGTSSFLIRLIAPALMGLVLMRFPASAGIWLGMLMYLVSTALLWPAWVSGPRLGRPRGRQGSWKGGWQHIFSSPVLRSLLAMDMVVQLVGWASWSTTVAFLAVVLNLKAAYAGTLMACTGLAGAAGTRLASRVRPGRSAYLAGLAVLSWSYLCVPQVDRMETLVALWLVRGLAMGLFTVLFSQQVARHTPPDRMGRVQAAWEMSVRLAAFTGTLSTAWLLPHLGPAGSFYLFGAGILAVAVVCLARPVKPRPEQARAWHSATSSGAGGWRRTSCATPLACRSTAVCAPPRRLAPA